MTIFKPSVALAEPWTAGLQMGLPLADCTSSLEQIRRAGGRMLLHYLPPSLLTGWPAGRPQEGRVRGVIHHRVDESVARERVSG